MEAVWQKIKADILSRPMVSILILVTIIASATLLTLATATLMNTNAPYDRTFEELNAAHVWIYFDRDKLSQRDVERIEALPDVVESTGLRYNVVSRVRIGDTHTWVSLRAIPLEQPSVNRMLVQEGRYLAPHQKELLAGKDLKDWQDLSVGELVGITRADGKKIDLPVIGLAYNAMWDIYRTSQPPYIYVSEDTLRELFPDDSTWDWSIGLRLANPNSVDDVIARVEDMLGADAIEEHTDWRKVRDTATFDTRIASIFLGAFSVFAILATVLVIASSISSIVLSQFKQIGILKAIGFTQAQVLWLYLGQYLVLGSIGSLIGLPVGFILAPLPLKSVAISLSSAYHPPLDLSLVGLVFGVVAGVIICASLGAALRGARANTVQSIAIGVEAPRKKLPWIVRVVAQMGMPAIFLLGVTDVFARPFRSLLTGFNLMLGVIGITFGLTLTETLDTFRTDPSLMGIVHDATVTRETTSDAKTRHLLNSAPGAKAFYGEYLADVKTQSGQSFKLRAVEGDLAAFPFRIPEGQFFEPNTYEAIAGQGLLDWLGLEVGDEITITFTEWENRPVVWQIVGQYLEPANDGQLLMVSLSTVARYVKDAEPSTYYLKLAPDCDMEQLKQYIEPRPDSDLNLSPAVKISDYVIYLQLAVFALSAILIGVALVNVFNTSLLAMQEKLRTIGILKAVGMTPAQVITMTGTTAGFLGLLAVGSGIPAGLAFTRGLLNTLSRTLGFGKMQVTLSYVYILLLLPLMVGISILGSLIPGWQAARLPIAKVLRHE
jgi:putative ABC transport system permease protein